MSGTISITHTGPIIARSTVLTANYSGTEAVTYRWNKNEVPTSVTTVTYAPSELGSYTVTVSAESYHSKTSAAVTVSIMGISTLEQLNAISASEEALGRNYKLLNDITGTVTTCISKTVGAPTPFYGDFDGNGKTITVGITNGLTASVGPYAATGAGLFAASAGSIHNLNVAGTVNITTGSGVLVLYAGGVVGALLPGATISRVSSSVAVTAASGGIVNAGGIVGGSQGTISNVYTTGNVSGATSGANPAKPAKPTSEAYVGGIVGGTEGPVSYAYATGAISASGTGTGQGIWQSGDGLPATVAAGGIAGAANTSVRYTVAMNSSIAASSSSYHRGSFRIASTSTGYVTTDGAANYGKAGLNPTGSVFTLTNVSNNSNGADTPASPDQTWWTGTGFAGSDWTTVWKWDSTKSLPVLR